MTTDYRDNRSIVTLIKRCRDLRRNSTDAESLLWSLLRARQLNGAKFRRQHQFGPFILDFYCAEHRLAVELDGGQHFLDANVSKDEVRERYLEGKGITVLRFTNLEVLQATEAVLERILQEIE